MMYRPVATVLLLLFCNTAYAHDYTVFLAMNAPALVSFLLSVYIAGKGNRIWWSVGLFVAWIILWTLPLVVSNVLPLMIGTIGLMFISPFAAYFFKSYRLKKRKENNHG